MAPDKERPDEPLNIFVSSADTVTPVLPKNDRGVLLNVIPNLDTSVFTANIALVSPEFRNAFASILVTDDGMVMDVKKVASWKAFASILLKPVIVRLRAYDKLLLVTIVLVKCPAPLNT